MEERKYIIFQLGEQKYGMNLSYVNGIEQDYHIIPVPNAPEGIRGIINLRGLVVPVYSLRERFGMDVRVDNPAKSMLITMSSNIMLGYEVDAVLGIEEVAPEDISKMPFVASNEETSFMEQVLCVKEGIIIAINVNKVLSDDMEEVLNQMVEEHQ
ncbi:MAG: chemotaxis protein CheW [Clostridiales bacterium]|nr:chemotaxis protein CheW [Clostridiales bacterium]